MGVHGYSIDICDECIRLEGDMCNNHECVFCRRTMAEVGEYLDVLLIRPVVDGERMPAPSPAPAAAEMDPNNESEE